MAPPRRAAVFCTFDGCDAVATASLGVSAFCPLHHSTMMSLLDRGSPSEYVESTPVESTPVESDETHDRGARGTR